MKRSEKSLTKSDWILLLLKHSPLDRIHLMGALFLIWHRSGRNIKDYFVFESYLYGPCSFEVYAMLDDMEARGLIVRPWRLKPLWVNYYLTRSGEEQAEAVAERTSRKALKLVKDVVKEISSIRFCDLLRKIYAEAPDFAVNSIFKRVVNV